MPVLYTTTPALQALAVMPPGQADTTYWQSLQRIVPIVTPDDVNEETAYDLSTFMASLNPSSDVITLLDPSGRCTWTSDELDHTGSDLAIGLRSSLQQALPREAVTTDEAMDIG